MIDDELYVSVRIRVPEGMDDQQQYALAAKVLNGAAEALGGEDWPAVHAAGFEATFATFRPLPDREGQVMQFARDKHEASTEALAQLNRDDMGGDPDV